MIDVQLYIYITKPEESRQLGRIGSDQLPLLAQVLVVHVPHQAVLEPDKRYRVSQKKVSDKIFPRRLPNGPTANFVAGHLVACQRSACYFFEGMTRSSRMLHSSAESWSVVHVRWEVVEEKFYQRLFSGTPCSSRLGLWEVDHGVCDSPSC